ncbi:integrase arm-type DNA-binding domain-containing protein [Glaciimonas sp. Gout2]|uniref:tyrosine-type recombinase/integrase n=1 Tax=unclassified Glaciimonas TaxID=2644401 RepID=UPI002B234C5E|nr:MULTISPECIES: integrase arm-type DNA-binding domain-containing protein [unclassified Glaciimonas]MEB0011283.1 integrase arm-type DNA-binding domain-containing protein [Glaciimonas sp. Cout2]MEB0080933.1 integrase arm-type DNA-binding domain-containing protein [Glaciimonas sp. Gout2]
MPKLASPLTDLQVKSAKPRDKPYTLADGGGMYLEIAPTGSKTWRMAYRQPNGKNTRLTFGAYPAVSLTNARKKREAAREQRAAGTDPAQLKRDDKQATAAAAANTFERVAWAWLGKTAATRAETTQDKVTSWLKKDVFPYIGEMPVSTIKPIDVLSTIQKMEARGAIDSAHSVRRLCGQILRHAVASGLTERDVTVDLKGALSVAPQVHYAAITEPQQAGELMRSIHTYTGHPYAVAALKLSPLLFVRPGELRSAEWIEIDLDAAEWRIPASKMKMKVDHLVPLSVQAVEILRGVHLMTGGSKFVFPSIRTGARCMSENTITAALRSMGYSKEVMTAHGFRAMARTIMDEVMGERVDLIEHQLAHAVKDPNGRAYNRTAHLPARRKMMQRWSDYLGGLRDSDNAIPFKAA